MEFWNFWYFMFDYGSPKENWNLIIETIQSLNILEITLLLYMAVIVLAVLLYMDVCGLRELALAIILTGIIGVVIWIFFTYVAIMIVCFSVIIFVYAVLIILFSRGED